MDGGFHDGRGHVKAGGATAGGQARMRQVLTPALLDDLYRWLVQCAEAGRMCPGNAEIARRYAFASGATAAKAIGRLEKDRRIAVQRGWTARRVTITGTGASTAEIRQSSRRARKASRPGQKSVFPPGPRTVGPKGRQCQWIDGEPDGDDACKCLRTTATQGGSWCAGHLARVYLPPEVAEARFGGLPALARAGGTSG
jgi:hypothetical protein